MPQKMLKFIDKDRQMPEKRGAETRRADFHEVYSEFITKKAEEQASRCSQCGVPFCQEHCPLHNNIPDWLMLTAEGRLEEAYRVSASTNSMPEICGRICPQDRLCEGSCVIEQSGHGTVTIGAVEKYITDTAWEEGWVDAIAPPKERSQSIGIIGSGPGGLAAAERLRMKGYQVTIYDRHDRAGGLLVYGIPPFKLEKHVVTRRVERLEKGGVTFKLNADIGGEGGPSFSDIRDSHDAILVATGVYKAKDLDCPGSSGDGVTPALEYLIASNRQDLGDDVPELENGSLNAKDKNVVVIGGGDTAMDCVRTAVRQGAKSVTCLYRRDKENMPGSARETENAEEEGVEFKWLAAPKAILSNGDGVTAVKAVRMRLGAADNSGRLRPEEVPGSDYDVPADMVIKALGFDAEDLPLLFEEDALPVDRWGTIKIDWRDMQTQLKGVFAIGDIVRGASLVVWAVKDGHDAADGIHKFLSSADVSAIAAE